MTHTYAPRSRGAAFKDAVTARYELQEHELALLDEIARTMDDLDALAARVETAGHIIAGRVNPALVEARQMRIALARLVAALRLPEDEDSEGVSLPQRRVGVRGFYSMGGAA
jgi:hypothetical protein